MPDWQLAVKRKTMKKVINFKSGIRGKYANKTIEIVGAVKRAGATNSNALMVKIDDDLAAVYKTSAAVNKALRDSLQKKRKVVKGTIEKMMA